MKNLYPDTVAIYDYHFTVKKVANTIQYHQAEYYTIPPGREALRESKVF